jgi:hypothetical protein
LCRRCDRARPVCQRCITKGLECGGYPPKFKFCGVASRGKWSRSDQPFMEQPRRRSSAKSPNVTPEHTNQSPIYCLHQADIRAIRLAILSWLTRCRFESSSDMAAPNMKKPFLEIDDLLAAVRTQELLTYCSS